MQYKTIPMPTRGFKTTNVTFQIKNSMIPYPTSSLISLNLRSSLLFKKGLRFVHKVVTHSFALLPSLHVWKDYDLLQSIPIFAPMLVLPKPNKSLRGIKSTKSQIFNTSKSVIIIEISFKPKNINIILVIN